MNQSCTPLADALLKQAKDNYIPFDVPGHKGSFEMLEDIFGEKCVALDKNSRKSIDFLCNPKGVILEAEKLAADAFGAADAFFMVGGTTSAIQAMIMSSCSPKDKIILPRNVHYSVINAVILAGITPVYIEPPVHERIGIALATRVEDLEKVILENKDAKAVLINNPTYYGICSDIERIVKLAHEHNMLVLVDEAHGTHFYFSDRLPVAAMHCGADFSAVSMHKTGGAFTQSSILLSSGKISKEYVQEIINLTCTTSPSYILMASLDIARKNMVENGRALLSRLIDMTNRTRSEINKIDGFYAFSEEIIDNNTVFDFDLTKLSVNTQALGLAGIDVYKKLRDDYNIQIEFGDVCNFLAICSFSDKLYHHESLINALKKISKEKDNCCAIPQYEYIVPTLKMSPRKAFYAPKTTLHISEAENRVSACSVMAYPPGIPILAPGELITRRIIDHILFSADRGCSVSGLGKNLLISVVQE